MIRVIFGITAIFYSLICQAEKLSSFEEISSTVANGKGIRAVIDINLCTGNLSTQSRMIGSVNPSDIVVIADKYITFSSLHLTQHNPDNKGIPLYEYNKFTLTPNHKLTMESTLLNPVTFKQQGKGYRLECELNKGGSIYSVR